MGTAIPAKSLLLATSTCDWSVASSAGEVVVKAMTLGVNPPVGIKWTYRKTVECPVEDHLVVDLLQITNNSPAGPE
jgi:hypothetical protein